MRVRANSYYTFDPVPLDILDPKTDLEPGSLVQVKKLPGCPPPNTMNHAHIYHNGKFAGLVHVNSLIKIKGGK